MTCTSSAMERKRWPTLGRNGVYAEPSTSPRPDLVLLDLNLPRMNGHEVLRQCKQDDRFKHIPIVVLTTSGQ